MNVSKIIYLLYFFVGIVFAGLIVDGLIPSPFQVINGGLQSANSNGYHNLNGLLIAIPIIIIAVIVLRKWDEIRKIF